MTESLPDWIAVPAIIVLWSLTIYYGIIVPTVKKDQESK